MKKAVLYSHIKVKNCVGFWYEITYVKVECWQCCHYLHYYWIQVNTGRDFTEKNNLLKKNLASVLIRRHFCLFVVFSKGSSRIPIL